MRRIAIFHLGIIRGTLCIHLLVKLFLLQLVESPKVFLLLLLSQFLHKYFIVLLIVYFFVHLSLVLPASLSQDIAPLASPHLLAELYILDFAGRICIVPVNLVHPINSPPYTITSTQAVIGKIKIKVMIICHGV